MTEKYQSAYADEEERVRKYRCRCGADLELNVPSFMGNDLYISCTAEDCMHYKEWASWNWSVPEWALLREC